VIEASKRRIYRFEGDRRLPEPVHKAGGANLRTTDTCIAFYNYFGGMRWISLFALMLYAGAVKSQTMIPVGVNTNIRALAAVDSNHWWFGGSNGWLGHTADGGKSWELRQPAGSAVDFRSIHAFNQQEAVAAIAGQPAQIYRTQDGGKRWELVHWLKDTTAFIDAIGFWNAQDGLLFGEIGRAHV